MRALRHLYLAYFAKPAGDRILYRTLRQHRCHSIVEIGIGCIERTERLLRMAAERNGAAPRYAAIDLFDLRAEATLPLKDTFKRLKARADKVRLLPGEPDNVLRQSANDLLGADLLLFTAQAFASLTPASWFFVPRMLKDAEQATTGESSTLIFVAETTADGKPAHRAVTIDEIKRLATGVTQRRAA